MPIDSYVGPNLVRNTRKAQKFVVRVDFKAYPEQLEFFFLANGVTDLKRPFN